MTDFEQVKDEIKARVSILDVVSHYVDLKSNGSNHVGLCPFHNEKTPSFNVSPDKGIFKCFGCGKSGDVFTFLMEKENYTFPEAMSHLAAMVGVELEKQGQMTPAQRRKYEFYDLNKRLASSFCNILLNKKEAEPALKYLNDRGINLATIEDYQLGYLPDKGDWLWNFLKKRNYSEDFLAESGLFSRKHKKFSLFTGRLVFPIYDKSSRVIAFSGRQMKDFGPKYINSPETPVFHKSDALFGIHKAVGEIRRKESVYLVEGNFDVISMHQSGVLNCVAPLGTAFTDSQAEILKKNAKKVWCLFDGDAPGLKAAEKASMVLMRHDIVPYIIELPPGMDPSDILKKDGAEALQNISKYSINSFDYLLDKAVKLYGIDNIEKKEQVVRHMLPFIQLFNTEIRKNDAVRSLAENVGIDFISLQKDLAGNHFKLKEYRKPEKGKKVVKSALPDKEMMLLVTASLKIDYYRKVRVDFKLKDFKSSESRELFIALEDCYRHERFNSEMIIEEIESEELKLQVGGWLQNSSFIQDPERTLSDSGRAIKLRNLQIRKIDLQAGLNSHNYGSMADNDDMGNVLEEILFISNEIERLKGDVNV